MDRHFDDRQYEKEHRDRADDQRRALRGGAAGVDILVAWFNFHVATSLDSQCVTSPWARLVLVSTGGVVQL